MNKKLMIRAFILVSMLALTVIFTPAHSQGKESYNAGLLASESGDYDTAVVKWQPLASQGDAAAQFNLALMYHSGLGVAMNEEKAVHWYQESATNGYVKAQEFLAAAYREGWFGLEKDMQKADYWGRQLDSKGL